MAQLVNCAPNRCFPDFNTTLNSYSSALTPIEPTYAHNVEYSFTHRRFHTRYCEKDENTSRRTRHRPLVR